LHRSARLAAGGVALAAFGAALWIAAHHPLSPLVAVVLSAGWAALAARFPRLWLFVLPAALPVMNLSPWTGWTMVEEFDLLVLGAVAAGHARIAWRGAEGVPAMHGAARWVVAALAVITLASLWRGVVDAGGARIGWFDDYTGPLNSLRVSKSLLFALLLLPLLRREVHELRAGEGFACGMVTGAVIVAAAALWERLAYPGLLNFSDVYRTTALFWEMHVGGAAIDAYLALATPFVAWTLWRARTTWQWALAALLALVWVYVCLTTFARGVYLGVLTAIAVLAVFRLLGGTGWRRWAGMVLGVALLAEVVGVLGWGSFMAVRLSNSERDYQSRTAHWARGVALLDGPVDWVLGVGAGRLPARYEGSVDGAEFPGAVRWDEAQGSVLLSGPRSMDELGGLYTLTQRVPRRDRYRLALDLRAEQPAGLLVRVCSMHLLYEHACQGAYVRLRATQGEWRRTSLHLRGPALEPGPWFAPRQTVLRVAVLSAGEAVELDNLVLLASGGERLLRNGDFGAELAHWLPAAQYYFMPWHIDNLYLEWLIERGLLGLGVFVALLLLAGARALRGGAGDAVTPFLLASLAGVLSVGLVSSVLDVPRVALLMWLAMALLLLRRSDPGRAACP